MGQLRKNQHRTPGLFKELKQYNNIILIIKLGKCRQKAEKLPELVAPPLVRQNQQALEFEGSSICLRKLHPNNYLSVHIQ